MWKSLRENHGKEATNIHYENKKLQYPITLTTLKFPTQRFKYTVRKDQGHFTKLSSA